MKKLGIVGGVGWPSTVEYYTEICRLSEERHLASGVAGAPSIPEMTIESLDHQKAVAYLGIEGDEQSWTRFDEYHRSALLRLEAAGSDFALIASNTPHHRFDSIVRGVGIPVLNLFEAAAREAARLGVERVLILGTALTMSSQRFRDAFSRHGIEAASPSDQTLRTKIVQLVQDLQISQAGGAAERLSAIAQICMQAQLGPRPLVCLACTELPLAFPQHKSCPYFELDGVNYLNTTAVHARTAFAYAAE